MAVDDRRDHSFRVPRPDLSLRLGVPNACTGCHLESENLPETKRDRLKLYQDWVEAARRGDTEVAQELARVDSWATRYVIAWYGDARQSSPHFADTLAAAWTGNPAARDELIELSQDKSASGIVRASAVQALGQFGENEEIREALRDALRDPDPQVRLAALGHFDAIIPNRIDVAHLAPQQREAVRERLRTDVTAILPLLDHHLRSVRIEAARVLSRVPDDMLPQLATGPQRTALEQAMQEFRRGLLAQSERAGAHMGLGMLAENLGDDDEAERQYRTAIRLEPTTSGLRSQLALMLERIAQEDAREAVNLLLGRPADADMPEDVNQLLERRDDEFLSKIAILSPAQMDRYAELYQRVQQRQDEAELLRKVELPLLARDARALPDSGEVQYAYACSLYINGREDEAEKALQTARKLMPYSELPVLMLARFYQKQKKWPEAIQCAQRLLELAPDNPQYDALLTELRRQRGGGAP
jgi:tetratricopeptide (TPR) repeat protein